MDERNLTTGDGGPLQLTIEPESENGLEIAEDGATDLQVEEEEVLTSRIGGGEEMALRIRPDTTERLNLGNSFPVMERNYERLENKPKINGVELLGDRTLEEIFGGGLIIDGGDAESIGGEIVGAD